VSIQTTNLAPVVPAVDSRIGPRTVVSSLWLFAILNYLYCDLLGLMYPEDLQGFLDGKVGGLVIDQQFLLYAAILMTVPMASVLISRIATRRFARIESIAAAVVMTLVQLATLVFGTPPTLHYLYFSVIEVATTIAIVWMAARRWKRDS
jgi:NADH:ubiquinone oxidoreductase subunit K